MSALQQESVTISQSYSFSQDALDAYTAPRSMPEVKVKTRTDCFLIRYMIGLLSHMQPSCFERSLNNPPRVAEPLQRAISKRMVKAATFPEIWVLRDTRATNRE